MATIGHILNRFEIKLKSMKKVLGILLLVSPMFEILAQIGLQINSSNDLDGYILYQPNNNVTTYLIDRKGYVVTEWDSDYQPGRAVYLLENGNLLKTARIDNPNFIDGGRGGRIELINSNNEIIWSYELSNESESLHHDIAYLPNGNILAITWEKISEIVALENGKNPDLMPTTGEIWMEKIIELEPLESNNANIVWEWRLIDHIIQDYDDTKPNYGNIQSNFRKLDFNYQVEDNGSDWIHMNAIDYNEELDQIVLSTPFLNEIWVIDHSTTTEEASSSTGGDAGHGGDFLFRWGNNHSFGMSDLPDRYLFGQHNPHWVKEGEAWKILLFNNGRGRNEPYSNIERIDLTFENDELNYTINNGVFNSTSTDIYTAENKLDFYSSFVSGVQDLGDNQYLICEGANGRIFQIDDNKEIVWEYINPIDTEPKCTENQGETGGIVFRASFIPESFSGLSEYNVEPKYLLEELGCPLNIENDKVDIIADLHKLPNGDLAFSFADGVNNINFHSIDGKRLPFYHEGTQNIIVEMHGNTGIIIVNCAFNNQKIAKKLVLKN
ncbi:aryl-sulfate sulfotransferase [Ekhidna sp.]|uniref:aryl-sulfate sulfotransferase n=1 Tax=Ekhidna sp. TaxID=2608089 RepID=UPI003B5B333A